MTFEDNELSDNAIAVIVVLAALLFGYFLVSRDQGIIDNPSSDYNNITNKPHDDSKNLEIDASLNNEIQPENPQKYHSKTPNNHSTDITPIIPNIKSIDSSTSIIDIVADSNSVTEKSKVEASVDSSHNVTMPTESEEVDTVLEARTSTHDQKFTSATNDSTEATVSSSALSTQQQQTTKQCTIIIGAYAQPNNVAKLVQRLDAAGYDSFTQSFLKNTTQVGIVVPCKPDHVLQSVLSEVRLRYASDAIIINN